MTDSADHVSGKTGLTLTITASKDGGSFASISPTVTELANGWYKLALTSSHTDTVGDLALHITATGADPTDVVWEVESKDLFSALTGDAYARLGAPAGASVSADIAAVQSDTNDIQSRLPAALVSGRIDASVGAMAADTLTASALATSAVDEIVDAVWDEVLTGATHNVASSAGRRLRQLASVVIHDGTAQAGTINTITLDVAASSTSGIYDPGLVIITAGTGAGQTRQIIQYDGTTKIAAVDRDWRVTPDNTSVFQIQAYGGTESVNEGLAQGGTANTITLNAAASAADDDYNGQICFIRSGTGQDQTAVVVDYNGTTKVATIKTATATGNWITTPDATSGYVMIPSSPVVLAGINHVGAQLPDLTAVKAKTDSLNFTVAGSVDANIQQINDVTITGNGQAGTEFNV